MAGLSFLAIPILVFPTDSRFSLNSATNVFLFLFQIFLGALLLRSAWRLFTTPADPYALDSIKWWLDLCSNSTITPDDFAAINSHISNGDHHAALQTAAELLESHLNDPALLWWHAELSLELDQPLGAETTCDNLLGQLTTTDPSHSEKPAAYFHVLAKRLHAILLQNDGRFETELNATLRQLVSDQSKTALLDQLACIPLTQSKPQLYPVAESCIRKALDLAPGTLTLKGTLGSLLIEQGNFTAGEPLIRECYNRSTALHDRGICSYYLALLAAQKSDSKTARKLATQSIALYPEPWLVAKAKSLLDRLKNET
ncbi:MAG TPA: hypothetical protein VF773_07460 [Verrucomicrobiae bacterium]